MTQAFVSDVQVMTEKLRSCLPKVLGEEIADSMIVHLADLYAASMTVRRLIDELSQSDADDPRSVRKALIAVDTELFEHVTNHLDELRPALQNAVEQLYGRED